MGIGRNTALNFIGIAFPVALSLITVPLYLHYVGDQRYGVLSIAWLLLGYFGLFDLGLGRATAQKIATLRGVDPAECAATLWTAIAVNVGTGAIGGAMLWLLSGWFFRDILVADNAIRAEIVLAVPLLAATVPMATISGVLIGVLQGCERFGRITMLSVTGAVATQLIPLAVAIFCSPSIFIVMLTTVTVRLGFVAVFAFFAWQAVGRGQPISVGQDRALELLRFGGWVTISMIVGPLMTILDRFVIGALAGARAVTQYTVPFQLAQRLLMLPGALTETLFPKLSASGPEERARLAQLGARTICAAMTLVCAPALLGIEPFLKIWLGEQFAGEPSEIGRIIVLGIWSNALAYVPAMRLQAQGRPRVAATIHLIELPFYLLVFFVALNQFGLVGAAAAFTLRCVVDLAIFSVIGLGQDAPWRMYAASAAVQVACYAAAVLLAPLTPAWFAACAILLSGTALICWQMIPDEVRQALLRRRSQALAGGR